MRTLLLALATAFLFIGCGGSGGAQQAADTGSQPIANLPPDADVPPAVPSDPPGDDTPSPTPAPAIEECMLKSLDAEYGKECQVLIYNGEVIAGPVLGERRITFHASLRAGNKTELRNFDGSYDFADPVDLVLPARIESRWDTGGRLKIYIRINAYTDCVWFAAKGGGFDSPRCFEAAERSPGNGAGFKGGIEVDHVRALEVTRLEMTVDGKGGKKGELTTAVAIFEYE